MLAVGKYPYISGDTGVVEKVERKGDNRLQPVIIYKPAPDIAFALPGIACKKRRTVMNLSDTAAQWRLMIHLGCHVRKKKHLAVTGAGDKGVVSLVVVANLETRVTHAVFASHGFKVFLPALTIRRIGEHEVELACREGIV